MTLPLTDEMVEAAARAFTAARKVVEGAEFHPYPPYVRAALIAVLPMIERAVRAEIGKTLDRLTLYDGSGERVDILGRLEK